MREAVSAAVGQVSGTWAWWACSLVGSVSAPIFAWAGALPTGLVRSPLATLGTGPAAAGSSSGCSLGVPPFPAKEVRGKEAQLWWVLIAFSSSQFEAGPYGCILLTLSAILSRTTEL